MSDAAAPDELLDELRALFARTDAVPDEVGEFARAALGFRRIDAELAELLADSALETDAMALARSGSSGSRSLTFRAAELTVAVEVQADAGTRIVLGQLVPAPPGTTVEAQAADGAVLATVQPDTLGRFRFALETVGRIRFRILAGGPGAAPVETSWVSL